MAKKLKIDPITQAKNAVSMFENMLNALDFLNDSVKDMIQFNLNYSKKQLQALEEKENAELDKMDTLKQTS